MGLQSAYNAQFCTDTESDIIVEVQVSQQGNDTGLACPMLDQVEEVHGERPAEIWADASYFSIDEVVKMSQTGCIPYFAIPRKNRRGDEKVEDTRYLPKVNDAPAVAACRERMATPEAHESWRGILAFRMTIGLAFSQANFGGKGDSPVGRVILMLHFLKIFHKLSAS
jgi:hypothetical protein